MKRPSDLPPKPAPMNRSIANLIGLGERSVQKSYYPQLQQKIQELEKSERQYRLLAENISDVIFSLNQDLSIDYISPSIERMSGYPAETLKGKPFTILLDDGYVDFFRGEIEKAFAEPVCTGISGSPLIKELELKQTNRDGSLTWVEIRLSCLKEPHSGETANIQQILGISRDITERKNAQKEKEAMQIQLLQAQKMESIGTLAGGIAHDFNNLLTVINGYANLIAKKLPADDPMGKKVTAIAHAGQRAANLTRQLLAFSRKQIFSPKALDINATLGSMEQMLRRLIGEDIHVKTIMQEDISPISADQTQIEQIFTNLVVNARDSLNAMVRTGFQKKLTIETGQVRFSETKARHLSLETPGLYAFFSVSDNGCGMDKETQKRIFEPFFTTKAKDKGTGLGLAMIYGIVKQNHGAIRVYSEPDHGALFKIYWPVASDSPVPAEKPDTSTQDLAGDEIILLVEDDPDVLNFAANSLLSLGYTIHKAANGRIALEWIKRRQNIGAAMPDVVITDLIMPEMSGNEFAQRLIRLIPEIKIIYVSGHTDDHIVHNGMLEDGVNFLQKPYAQQHLARMIRKVLNR